MNNDPDFYIGWQDKAPPAFARPVRWVVIGLFVLIPVVAVLLVLQQRGFSDAVFEYGTLTTVEGQLIREPVPFLRIPVQSKPGAAPAYERLLLIGFGKHGAEATIQQWEQKHGSLANKTLKISGTLIYYDGQAALELTNQADALLAVSIPKTTVAPISIPLGRVEVTGEITDPKCFLGVMKPGDGRPHRSCAVRCMAGGIPPLLYTTDPQRTPTGYILVGASGQPINAQMLGFVGKNIRIQGQLERADNWLILRVDAPVLVGQRLLDADRQLAICH